jgi:hypothetical protein
MNQCKPMKTSRGRLWWNALTFMLLPLAAVARAEDSAEKPRAVPFRSLADAGDIATPEAAQTTLDALAKQLVEKGGGYILVDNRVPDSFKPHNRYQTGRDQPSVMILDVRDGYMNFVVSSVGHDSQEMWSDFRVRRTLDLEGGSLPHWGTQAAAHIENNIVQGSYSVMRFLVEPVQAGDDARLYLQGIEGLAPGAYMNIQSNGGIPAGRKDVTPSYFRSTRFFEL